MMYMTGTSTLLTLICCCQRIFQWQRISETCLACRRRVKKLLRHLRNTSKILFIGLSCFCK